MKRQADCSQPTQLLLGNCSLAKGGTTGPPKFCWKGYGRVSAPREIHMETGAWDWWRTCKERFDPCHLCKKQEGLLTTTSVKTVGPLKTEVEGIWDPFGLLCLLCYEHGKTRTHYPSQMTENYVLLEWRDSTFSWIHINSVLRFVGLSGEWLVVVVFGSPWSLSVRPG